MILGKWRGRKFRNQPTEYKGVRYDSALEARCAQWLDARWELKEILWYTRQVPFRLEGGVVYRADFLACVPSGVEVIDATGMMTPMKKNKLKAMLERYGINVLLYSRSGIAKFDGTMKPAIKVEAASHTTEPEQDGPQYP